MQRAYELTVIRSNIAEPRQTLNAAPAVARFCQDLTRHDREHFVRLDLDCRCRLVARETVFIGTVDTVVISPREIFRGALLTGGRQMVLIHNHPSGDPDPSEEDRAMADRLRELGQMLDLPMIDFIVLGDHGRYWSMNSGPGRIHPQPVPPAAEQARLERYG